MSKTIDTPHEADLRADFGSDITKQTTGQAIRAYGSKLRSGELGSLPALSGLLLLVIVFALSSPVFLSLTNLSNLLSQGSGRMLIAMGLVFVLLVGEIDVSAGAASGVTAAILALDYVNSGNLESGMGNPSSSSSSP